MSEQTRMLYRPVGLKEMQLILDADATAFPPRLPEQPIFYPVLNLEYARQIAQKWNTKDPVSGYVGFVTQFEVDADYINQFDEQVVGGSTHRELWIPAEELETFNQHIVGYITIVEAYYGEKYSSADELLNQIKQHLASDTDVMELIKQNWKAAYLNMGFWQTQSDDALLLRKMTQVWESTFPHLTLPAHIIVPQQ